MKTQQFYLANCARLTLHQCIAIDCGKRGKNMEAEQQQKHENYRKQSTR